MSDGHIQTIVGKRGTSYRLKFDLGRDPKTGKRQTRQVTFRGTKAEAKKKLTELLNARNTKTLAAPTKQTVSEYLETWINEWCRVNVGPATRESYTFAVRAQILPHTIGNVRLQDLQGTDVSAWHADLMTSGLARQTIRKCHRILHKALQVAVEDKLLTTNPLATKKAPRAEQEEVQILQPDEIPLLLNGFKDHPLRAFVVLALGSGARRSELLALTWAHVDLEAASIKIERNLEDTRELGIRVKSTKTAAGRRTIGIPPQAVDALRLHRKEQQELWLRIRGGRLPDDALIFGKILDAQPRSPTSVSREFSRQRKRIGLRYIKLHALRHTHASALIKAGVPITEIAKRLGHSSPVITLKVYGHLFGDQDSASVAAISATLAGAFN